MKCKNCGEELSKKEEREIREMQSYCVPEIVCDDCADCTQNDEPDFDQFSDADMGL